MENEVTYSSKLASIFSITSRKIYSGNEKVVLIKPWVFSRTGANLVDPVTSTPFPLAFDMASSDVSPSLSMELALAHSTANVPYWVLMYFSF